VVLFLLRLYQALDGFVSQLIEVRLCFGGNIPVLHGYWVWVILAVACRRLVAGSVWILHSVVGFVWILRSRCWMSGLCQWFYLSAGFVCSDSALLLQQCLGVTFAVIDVVLRWFLVVIDDWFVADQKYFFFVKTLSLLSFLSLRRQPCNQIANVDFLLIPDASGGFHRARCFGGLQFAQICVECA
jgi:hypothetical protein